MVAEEAELLERLRAGDEQAFAALVSRYHPSMVRFASSFVPSRAVAEEVVQDAWLGVVRGIERFEGRSSFQTWLFRIVGNRARSTGTREKRTLAFGTPEPAVDPARFDAKGGWISPPKPWMEEVEDRLDAARAAGRIRELIDTLPDGQRQVVMLRDVEGLSPAEVCDVLDLTEGNQRVLLHRGRSRIRNMLEREAGQE